MYKLKIKPLSLNKAYRGRRFNTPGLEAFKKEVYFLAPKIEIPDSRLRVRYIFGVSSKGSDVDNLVKTFLDSLCEKYNFNDNRIYKFEAEKKIVKKGEEYIMFDIFKYE